MRGLEEYVLVSKEVAGAEEAPLLLPVVSAEVMGRVGGSGDVADLSLVSISPSSGCVESSWLSSSAMRLLVASS